jgi:hypothetical protein
MFARAPFRAIRLLLAIATAAVLTGLLSACGDVSWAPEPTPVPGQGSLVTEDRTKGDFTRISVGAALKVIAKQAAETKVTLEAQENLLPLIKTEVVDGQLVVNVPPPGITTSQPITLTISAPRIESLALSAASTGYLETAADALKLDAAGGSTLTAIGSAKDLTLQTSAGSHAELGDLKARDAKVTLTDSSSAKVNATASVSGTASGGSTLVLTQVPPSMGVTTSGGATIQGGS